MTNHHSIHIYLLLLITLLGDHIFASSRDIVERSCLSCARATPSLSYDFCVASLRSVPVSQYVDLRGLALISVELALVNASDTISTVEGMIDSGSYDHNPIGMSSLRECLECYEEATSALLQGMGEFTAGEFKSVGDLVSWVMHMSRKCEDGFDKIGEICPLKRENYDLFQLCDIAFCIVVGNLSFGHVEISLAMMNMKPLIATFI